MEQLQIENQIRFHTQYIQNGRIGENMVLIPSTACSILRESLLCIIFPTPPEKVFCTAQIHVYMNTQQACRRHTHRFFTHLVMGVIEDNNCRLRQQTELILGENIHMNSTWHFRLQYQTCPQTEQTYLAELPHPAHLCRPPVVAAALAGGTGGVDSGRLSVGKCSVRGGWLDGGCCHGFVAWPALACINGAIGWSIPCFIAMLVSSEQVCGTM